MANTIKQIQVGTLPYDISAKYILNGTEEKTWEDIEKLVSAGFTIEVPWTAADAASTTAPTQEKLENIPAGVVVSYDGGTATGLLSPDPDATSHARKDVKTHIYLIYHSHGGKDNFDEYVSTGSVWELIGNTDIDLSDYAKHGTYNTNSAGSGDTGNGGATTIETANAGAQTAAGTATVSYSKANTATGSSGGTGVSANTGTAGNGTYNPDFTGTAATITVEADAATINDHSFTPSGSVTLKTTAASTTSINNVTAAALDGNPTFTGTAATITVSGSYTPAGSINVAVNDIAYTPTGTVAVSITPSSYTPEGEISGSQNIPAHSHTVNATKATLTYVSGTATGSNGSHSHTVESHDHGADVSALSSTCTFTSNGDDKFTAGSLPSITIASAPTSKAIDGWDVDDGVLILNTPITVVTEASKVSGWNAGTLPTFTQGSKASFTKYTVTAAGSASAATLTTVAAGAHTHTLTNSTASFMTGATLNTAGSATINFANAEFTGTAKAPSVSGTGTFTGTSVTLKHTIGTKTFTGTAATISLSTSYTPQGSVSKPGISLTKTGVTVATAGISNVTGTFTGSATTLAHEFTDSTTAASMTGSYTPEGSISTINIPAHSHTYTKPADHTHSISFTTVSATGTAAVAISDHKHSVSLPNHTHSIGNHTHSVTI